MNYNVKQIKKRGSDFEQFYKIALKDENESGDKKIVLANEINEYVECEEKKMQ